MSIMAQVESSGAVAAGGSPGPIIMGGGRQVNYVRAAAAGR